ncbi:hypothetical protein J1614_002705 [Plenodomus biglobosus]|nr:hypothetical protein J1614_002705 [Plenodomus biglobosus]
MAPSEREQTRDKKTRAGRVSNEQRRVQPEKATKKATARNAIDHMQAARQEMKVSGEAAERGRSRTSAWTERESSGSWGVAVQEEGKGYEQKGWAAETRSWLHSQCAEVSLGQIDACGAVGMGEGAGE